MRDEREMHEEDECGADLYDYSDEFCCGGKYECCCYCGEDGGTD